MKSKLRQSDVVSMFRCAFYSAMGVAAHEKFPTDEQCLKWLQQVIIQAKHLSDPPVAFIINPVQVVQPLIGAALQKPVEVHRWDLVYQLPEWRETEGKVGK